MAGGECDGQSADMEGPPEGHINGADATPVEGTDEGDARGITGPSLVPRPVQIPVRKDDTHYNMNHPRRGMALIFNHEFFDIAALKPRNGTNVDCDNLERVLTSLGFKVTIFKDLPYKTLQDRIAQASAVDHRDNDCLFVAVLTHGELGCLYAKDTHYKPELLWHSFAVDRCPTLAGKPKLFFIQACQGDMLDGGVTVMDRTETDGYSSNSYKIPIHADFLIAYSTVAGYYSWRNTTRGSWFIQALVEELKEHGKHTDILTLLTTVNRKVAQDFQSHTPDCPVMHKQKQVPSINFMLTRTLVFGNK